MSAITIAGARIPIPFPLMRYLAIDLGDRRTGLAVGDAVTRIVTPAAVLEVPVSREDGAALLRAIAGAVQEQLGGARSPGEIVIGLPANMDGTEGPRARVVRQFAARIGAHTGRQVRFQDERLTSAAADQAMARTGLTH